MIPARFPNARMVGDHDPRLLLRFALNGAYVPETALVVATARVYGKST